MLSIEVKRARLPLRERIRHFTWAWFTFPMSTGGIALLLSATPHRFSGLDTIGTIVFVFCLAVYVLLTVLLLTRFALYKGTFYSTIHHPTESLFIPTFFLALATLISCTAAYAVPKTGPWLLTALNIVFWIYCVLSFLLAVLQYHLLFTGKPLTLQSMTPAWLLPIFPIMLSGTVASSISSSQPVVQVGPILVAGLTFQGLGILVAVFMYSNYIGRLMTQGLPAPNMRPGMFIAVGPPSFTALALIGLANAADTLLPYIYVVGTSAVMTGQVLKIIAVAAAIFLWALSLFFFCISLAATLSGFKEMKFHLSWWSFVFPNTGFIIAAISIGKAINSEGIPWVTSVATIIQVVLYFVVAVAHSRAVWKREILWPGQDEDREE